MGWSWTEKALERVRDRTFEMEVLFGFADGKIDLVAFMGELLPR
jgi:hypothetical protein